jgi:hypothetical protein
MQAFAAWRYYLALQGSWSRVSSADFVTVSAHLNGRLDSVTRKTVFTYNKFLDEQCGTESGMMGHELLH